MSGFLFGIFPGSLNASGTGLTAGPPDDPTRIEQALSQLQPPGKPFLVRAYIHYLGTGRVGIVAPINPLQYIHGERQLDLVLCYRSHDGDLADWAGFVRRMVREHGPALAKLQLAEEPNNAVPETGGDGASPNVRQAVIEGVIAGDDEARRLGLTVNVGLNAAVTLREDDDFWPDMGHRATPAFLQALGHVGFDFFPDVWRPVPPERLGQRVEEFLRQLRTEHLALAQIPSTVPIHVSENGWATGPGKSEERQAEVIETVVRRVLALREELNITAYELFHLRDADSSELSPFHQLGVMRDDYTPKAAFDVYRRLVAAETVTSSPIEFPAPG
jgi:hypothetical protein